MSAVTRYDPADAYEQPYDSTSTMSGELPPVASGVQSVDAPQPHNNPCLLVFGTREPGAESLNLCKALWPLFHLVPRERGPGVAPLVVELSQDQAGLLADATATAEPRPALWREAWTGLDVTRGQAGRSIRELLHSRTSAERLASMPREHREAYERTRKIRDEIGPIGFNIVEALRELRGDG